MKRIGYLIFWIFFFLFSFSVSAKQRQWKGHPVHIGGSYSYEPYMFINDNGIADGYCSELIRCIFNRMNMDYEFMVNELNKSTSELKEGKIDIIPCMLYSTHCDNYFLYSLPIAKFHPVIAVKANSPWKTINDLRNKKIYAVNNGLDSTYIAKLNRNLKLEYIPNNDIAIKFLLHNVDRALYTKSEFIKWYEQAHPGSTDKLRIIPAEINYSRMCIATTYGNEKLLKEINQTILILQEDGTLDKIHKKWFKSNNETQTYEQLTIWRNRAFIFLVILIIILTLTSLLTRKQMHLMRKSKKDFKDALNLIPYPVFVTDISKNNKIIYWNEEVSDKLGPINNGFINNLLTPELKMKFHAINLQVIETGQPYHNQESYEENGNKYDIYISKYRIRKKNKYYILSMYVDITDLVIGREKAKLEDKKETAFMENICHEIRTPLNAIIGFTQLLIDDTIEKEQRKEYIKIINTNCDSLQQLINDIIDLSEIESHKTKIKSEDTEVEYLYNNIINNIKINQEQIEDVKFITYHPYNICFAYLDQSQIKRIVSHFIYNALKFTSKGTITTGYLTEEKKITFYVKDTGIGIKHENMALIFDYFQKINNFSKGTGLGLSLCKKIALNNRGTIGVQSEEGKGSMFWVSFPTEWRFEGAKDREIELEKKDLQDRWKGIWFDTNQRGDFLLHDSALNRKKGE